ncbi:MAG: hypothetical protein ACRDTC_17880 [Pseudonocardiaceae bacterium]
MRDFAGHLGVGMRTINKWEARLTDITLRPHLQEVMDTALARASDEAQARFAAVAHCDASAAEESPTAPTLGGMLPVVVDGRLVLVPFDVGALASGDLIDVLDELQYVAPTLPDTLPLSNTQCGSDFSTISREDESEGSASQDDVEAYLWFRLSEKAGEVKRSHFLQLGGLTVPGMVTAGSPQIKPTALFTERECAQWLAWELWQRGESALHVTDLPLSIAHYLGLINNDSRIANHLTLISPGGHILCDKDGYCSFAHPSFVDFYIAQLLFADIADGNSKLLTTAQTTHATDLVIQEFVSRHQSSADLLTNWMTKSANSVLRVNSAGILAKLGEPTTTDTVISTLKMDRDTRHLYLTAVTSRVLTLDWNHAAQLAAKIENSTSGSRPDLAAAHLELLTRELVNPYDDAARWCSTVLLGYFHNERPELIRAALQQALQTEPCGENLRAMDMVLAGNNPLTT